MTTAAQGIAQGAAVQRALASEGIQIAGLRWQWYPGLKGGVFEPHQRRDGIAVFNAGDGFTGDNAAEYGALPGEGVNKDFCMCQIRWILRGADGRFLPEKDEPR